MRKLSYVLLGLIMIGFTACNSNSIVGEWKLDTESMMEESDSSDAGAQMGKAMLSSMQMSFIFKDDGNVDMKVAFMGNEKVETLGYTIEGDQLTLSKEGEDDKSAKIKIEGDKMTISEMEGSSMEELVLVKQ